MQCPRCEIAILPEEQRYITVIDKAGVTEEIHIGCLDVDDDVVDFYDSGRDRVMILRRYTPDTERMLAAFRRVLALPKPQTAIEVKPTNRDKAA